MRQAKSVAVVRRERLMTTVHHRAVKLNICIVFFYVRMKITLADKFKAVGDKGLNDLIAPGCFDKDVDIAHCSHIGRRIKLFHHRAFEKHVTDAHFIKLFASVTGGKLLLSLHDHLLHTEFIEKSRRVFIRFDFK